MNAKFLASEKLPVFFKAAVLILLSSSVASFAQSNTKNPASKIFVTDVEGDADVKTGDQVEALEKRKVYTAEGIVIQTKKVEDERQKDKNTSAMVYSNGTGIFFDPDTRLEVKKFVQEPFAPNRSDMDVEPSISQTRAFLPHGSVGLCASRLAAGSSMVYQTPQATINIQGRKVVIETNEKYTKVSLLEGDSTVRGGSGSNVDNGGQQLHAGQQAIIRQGPPGSPPVVEVAPIPPSEMSALDDKVSMACIAKNTVYFQVATPRINAANGKQAEPAASDTSNRVTAFDSQSSNNNNNNQQEIVPVEVVPANLPVQYTISASRLGSQ
jgi:hypothetical protein